MHERDTLVGRLCFGKAAQWHRFLGIGISRAELLHGRGRLIRKKSVHPYANGEET